jgi:hypothetical protein
MTLNLSGSTGISGVDGSAGTPALQGTDSNTGISFPAADTVAINTGGSERTRVDSSGRLLIGTSTTSTVLTSVFQGNSSGATNPAIAYLCKGAAASSGDVLGILRFGDSSQNTYAQIYAEADAATGSGDYPGRLVFSTTADGASSPTEHVRINNNGRVDFGDSPGTNADQNLSAGGNNLYISIGSSFGNIALSTNCGAHTTSYDHYRFYNGNGQVGAITTVASSTSFTTSSDYRLKENVVPVSNGIARLQQLKPSRFNFKADPGHTVDGFIAHEVQTVVPEAITGEKDAVDDEGNPKYQGIDQSKLVPLLTAALQEAIGRIEQLEADVTALQQS